MKATKPSKMEKTLPSSTPQDPYNELKQLFVYKLHGNAKPKYRKKKGVKKPRDKFAHYTHSLEQVSKATGVGEGAVSMSRNVKTDVHDIKYVYLKAKKAIFSSRKEGDRFLLAYGEPDVLKKAAAAYMKEGRTYVLSIALKADAEKEEAQQPQES